MSYEIMGKKQWPPNGKDWTFKTLISKKAIRHVCMERNMSKILTFKTLISKKVFKMLVWRSKFARFLLLNVYLPYRSALFSPILSNIVLTYFMTFLNNAIEFTESSAHSSLQKKEIASKCTTN